MSADGLRHVKKRSRPPSIFSRVSGGTVASIRSRGSSLITKLQREMLVMQDDSFRSREWLLVAIEFLLAFSWNCIVSREKSEKHMKMRNLNPIEDIKESLLWLGWASIGNVIVGQLIDGVFNAYIMALLNVVFHFTLASLFLTVELIHDTASEDLYVYAMSQLPLRSATLALHYTFVLYFFKTVGGFTFTIVGDVNPSPALLGAIAFCFNGTVLFMYAYLLRPRRTRDVSPSSGKALKVWGIVFTALHNKAKFGKKLIRYDWLDYAENKYDRSYIARVKLLLRVILMALPTAGFLLFTTHKAVMFREFYQDLKLSGDDVPKYYKWIVTSSAVWVMITMEYGLFPLLRACRIKVNFMKRFLLGYLSLSLAVLIATTVTSITEKSTIRTAVGTMRVFNTLQTAVLFVSEQTEFTALNFNVSKNLPVWATFQSYEHALFRMAITFSAESVEDDSEDNTTSYVQLVTVAPEEVVQYVTITPSVLLRVPGFLPIKYGPPGTNNRWQPRCFVVNLIPSVTQSVHIINLQTEQRLGFVLPPGHIESFQVDEGEYVVQYDSSVWKKFPAILKTGGLYGIYLYMGLNEYMIDVDKVLVENTNHAMMGLLVYVPMGIAEGIGQVALDALIYSSAPEGLKGTAFGFYMACAHITSWFILIGYSTWHQSLTSEDLQMYTGLAFASFIICLVLIVRYRNFYTI